MIRGRWVGPVRSVGMGVVALGTMVSGIGLLDLLVRPGMIERVDTFSLAGVVGLLVLPPLTLSLGMMESRRRRGGVAGASVRAHAVDSRSMTVQSEPIDPDVSSGDGLPGPKPTKAVAPRVPSARPDVAPRRAAGGDLMLSVAAELGATESEPADPADQVRGEARVTQHDGRRREIIRRRASAEMLAVVGVAHGA
ncbi:MAG: hypothetical protein AAGI53_03140 [Planctomycetota bacterium]